MLGYIKPNKPELKVKELEVYKGYYCSLCKALGKEYGVTSRFLLSYDVTFFLILILALEEDYNPYFKKSRCPFNPAKRCNYCLTENNEFKYCAALSIIISYYKIKDNLSDDGFFHKLKYYFVYPLISMKHKKAMKEFPDIERIISSSISEQETLEKAKCSSVDIVANPTAKALSQCFEAFGSDESEKKVLNRFGYCVGRFSYLCDAFDDYESDKKHGGYNVFLLDGYDVEQIKSSIRMTMSEAALALDLLKLNENGAIVKNIVYDGLETELRKIIYKKEGKLNGKKSL